MESSRHLRGSLNASHDGREDDHSSSASAEEFVLGDAQRAQLLSQPIEASALHDAASLGRPQEVENLIRGGSAIEKPDAFGRTPLFIAAMLGHETVARTCAQMGARLDARDLTGMTPLHVAAAKGNDAVIDVLVEVRADIDARCKYNKTPLYHAVAGMQAATCRHLVKLGCNAEARATGVPTPLMLAVLTGCTLELEALVDVRCDIHGMDEDGSTPLHVSACKQRLEVMETLMERGARTESTDKWGMMPIHRAARTGEHEAVQRLVELKAGVSSRALGSRQTALHFAATANELETIDVLVQQRAKLDAQDIRGYTALHAAVEAGRKEALERLLRCGAPADIPTKAGDSALHLAVQNNSVELTQCLIDHTCNVNVRGRLRRSALHLAAEFGYMAIAQVLLGVQVSSNGGASAAANAAVTTASAAAASGALGGRQEGGAADRTSGRANVESSTPDGGMSTADPNARDEKRQTPLHLAAWNGCAQIIPLIHAQGAVVDILDAHGCTPLSHAVRQDHDGTVKTLIRLKADPMRLNEQGLAPLQQACMCGSLAVARLLHEMRMDPPHDEPNWRRPMALATFYGHTDVASYFAKPCPVSRLLLHMARGKSDGITATIHAIASEPPLTSLVAEVVHIPPDLPGGRVPTGPVLDELFLVASEQGTFAGRKALQEKEWLEGDTFTVDGLQPEAQYAMRLVAINDVGTSVGEPVIVETKAARTSTSGTDPGASTTALPSIRSGRRPSERQPRGG
eukprot:TRINITY_DN26932_c0_g2_i1.p1 TRINITY_DN26932_c0_g2~~TRINITY_DN26932_c0_g2_i1.p1  ORF type:complete len:790 (-),score=150.53 TRINITY_DN26932_c0_g2_i1:48-2279(-)